MVAARLYSDEAGLLSPNDPPPSGAPPPFTSEPLRLADLTSLFVPSRTPVTKDRIRTRLQWILEEFPTVNPSRSVLNRVNEFLISKRR